MIKSERLRGCLLGGAIGDAWGSGFENQSDIARKEITLDAHPWVLTDDTQLTLATMEAMIAQKSVDPEAIAQRFLYYYRQRKIRGLGASTLKALQGLSVGGHWALVGRRGERAAGNGAAMRIAPLAFKEDISWFDIQDVCRITHHNDEAYIGAKSMVIVIRTLLAGHWTLGTNWVEMLIEELPDTRVHDRLIGIQKMKSIEEVGRLGTDGYVVNTVPLAVFAANQVNELGMEEMFRQLIAIGGDTDTNCALAGQLAGTALGRQGIPANLLDRLEEVAAYEWLQKTITQWIEIENWN